MEGPRALRPDEFVSLARLLDSVFSGGVVGDMFARFPSFLCEPNKENLFVFAEEGRVVSHAGMLSHWARVAGCRVRVACLGAVATYPEYRKQGLASRLLSLIVGKARAEGVDFMMISGGLDIYRRAGANDVGVEHDVRIAAESLQDAGGVGYRFALCADEELRECARLYDLCESRFERSVATWRAMRDFGYCMNRMSKLYTIRDGEGCCAYLAVSKNDETGVLDVNEFAGAAPAITFGLSAVMIELGANEASLHLQAHDRELLQLLKERGATVASATATGTFLLINFGQFMKKLLPCFEERLGPVDACRLDFKEYGESCRFLVDGGVQVSVPKHEAVQVVFGHPERTALGGLMGEVFPVAPLWCGFNYV